MEEYAKYEGLICVVGPGLIAKVDEVTKHLRLL